VLSHSAYFDASGHPDDSESLFVAGYVSTVEKWLKFEADWGELLSEFGIKPPFHMKEFAPGIEQYASWKDDKVRRKDFVHRMVRLIKRRTHKSFACGVSVNGLAKMRENYVLDKPELYLPYSWCTMHALMRLHVWMEKNAKHGRLEIVLEAGDKHQGTLVEACYRLFKFYPVVRKKDDCTPFQICDFLAWEQSRLRRDFIAGKSPQMRGSLLELYRQVPNADSWHYADKDVIRFICESEEFKRKHENKN
jgi:hypothetical protein